MFDNMKEIKLAQGETVLVDDDDYEYLSRWKWQLHINGKTRYARRSVCCNGKHSNIKMHRLVVNAPKGMQVDHIDHNGLNNQKSNLRICTRSQNQANRIGFGKSKYLGVYVYPYKRIRGWLYVAAIKKDKKVYQLGYYDNEEDAARAYDEKAKELHGEFANLNFK